MSEGAEALRHAAPVCMGRAGSSPAAGSQTPDVGQPGLSCPAVGASFVSAAQAHSREAAVLPGPVTVLYQIREELTLGRNCEISPGCVKSMCIFFTHFIGLAYIFLAPPIAIMDITLQGKCSF